MLAWFDKSPKASDLLPAWEAAWPAALASWSHFTRLPPPRWLLTEEQERAEGLSGSFAMIRLNDQAILVSLRQVAAMGLGDFAQEVPAHEIGHHVLAPADLADNGRLLARLRAGLPGLEHLAPFVGNLYTDLLINDRLARSEGLRLAELYRALKPKGNPGPLWNLYMRIYEQLWSLPSGSLTQGRLKEGQQLDAALGARLVRAYSRDWLDGAGRFAALLYPYLLKEKDKAHQGFAGLLDATRAGAGDEIPDGLAEIEEGEISGALDPREDDELSGLGRRLSEEADQTPQEGPSAPKPGQAGRGGLKNRYRGPRDYSELMQSIGVKVPEKTLVMRYYRELARRHLIPFPSRTQPLASDPLPEGLEPWGTGEPLADLDWLESLIRSPRVIPGVTTLQRAYGDTEGGTPARLPLDLYLGIDCSGSMANPAQHLSYPVLAGTLLALSALRAGARVMACLSGEPGQYEQTPGLVRSEEQILRLLTGYLGTGYAFGIGRLQESILDQPAPKRPLHILIISDADLFHMLNEYPDGWSLAAEAAAKAGGGATALLNLPYQANRSEGSAIHRLEQAGWRVALVSTEAELVAFARAFARATYHRQPKG